MGTSLRKDDERSDRPGPVAATLGLLLWTSLFVGIFAYMTYENREYRRRVSDVAAKRAKEVALIVVAERFVGGDDGPDEWHIDMRDPQIGTVVTRRNPVHTTMRIGDPIDAYRCGPTDYLIPLFDRDASRWNRITRWASLAIGLAPLLWVSRAALLKRHAARRSGLTSATTNAA